MIYYWEEGFDDVYAKRSNRAGESWIKKWTANNFYSLQKATKYSAFKKIQVIFIFSIKMCRCIKRNERIPGYTKGMFSWIGFNKSEIIFDRDPERQVNQNGIILNFMT